MISSLRSRTALVTKKLLYGTRGEPFSFGDFRLRYVVGTRPVRLKYATSTDVVSRNDAKQAQFFLDNVRVGQVVLDIGGHYGEYAVLFAALVGSTGRVISFEPDIDARPLLRANLALNGFTDRVIVEDCAVSDTVGPQLLFARQGNSKSSLARAGLGGSPADDDVQKYEVPVVRLDEYVRRTQLQYPDFIKLDVEGAEINALRGAGDVLRSKVVIVCELHPYAWRGFGTSFGDLLRVVEDSGRSISYLDNAEQIDQGPKYGAVVIS